MTEAPPSTVADYLSAARAALDSVDPADVERAVDLLEAAYRNGRRVVLCGNGGSAATASHLACDLTKGLRPFADGDRPFEVLALTDSPALLTAWANDEGFAEVFAGQARTWLRAGDVLLALSGSGNSPNVLAAVAVAREVGASVVGLCGGAGGRLAEAADVAVTVPVGTQQQVEDVHSVLAHALYVGLRARLSPR